MAAAALLAALVTRRVAAWSSWPSPEPAARHALRLPAARGPGFDHRNDRRHHGVPRWPLVRVPDAAGSATCVRWETWKRGSCRRAADQTSPLSRTAGILHPTGAMRPAYFCVGGEPFGEIRARTAEKGERQRRRADHLVRNVRRPATRRRAGRVDNTILFGQAAGHHARVSADGGTPELARQGGRRSSSLRHRSCCPAATPVLFSVTNGQGPAAWNEAQIVVQSLATGPANGRRAPGERSPLSGERPSRLCTAFDDDMFAVAVRSHNA